MITFGKFADVHTNHPAATAVALHIFMFCFQPIHSTDLKFSQQSHKTVAKLCANIVSFYPMVVEK